MIEVIDATTEHIADLLRLLEDNAMQGDWELVMTRRPGYFSPRDDFGEVYPALARDGDTLVGMCQLSIQSGWVNGEEARMGYLGSLRIVPKYRNHLKVLQAGFSYLRQLPTPDHCYTSIAENNLLARRLLERGVEGLPLYRFLSSMSTLAISKSRGKDRGLWKVVPPEDYTDVIRFFALGIRFPSAGTGAEPESDAANRYYGARQLSERATGGLRYALGSACFQTGYCGRLLRQNENAAPALQRFCRNDPAAADAGGGEVVPQSFLSFLACTDDTKLPDLIEEALLHCTTPVMTVGLPPGHICTNDVIKRTGASVYRTRIYGVDLTAAPQWDGRIVWPEIALL
ncbi:GNAT family N-acetyltransferase [Morganella morganii]|nr:GNAT family N-acetyltransferase [Morganella morganii]